MAAFPYVSCYFVAQMYYIWKLLSLSTEVSQSLPCVSIMEEEKNQVIHSCQEMGDFFNRQMN